VRVAVCVCMRIHCAPAAQPLNPLCSRCAEFWSAVVCSLKMLYAQNVVCSKCYAQNVVCSKCGMLAQNVYVQGAHP